MDLGASRLTIRDSAEFGGGAAALSIDPLLAPLGREGSSPGSPFSRDRCQGNNDSCHRPAPLLPHGADL
jgi:hypothetical protein